MEIPIETPKRKKQKTREGSLNSGDQRGIQADFLTCLMCMMKTQRDTDSHIVEYREVIPQPFSRLLLESRGGISSHVLSTRASGIMMLDALLVNILRQGNVERAVAYRRVNLRCKPCERHRMVAFMEFSLSVGEEAKAMRTTIDDMQADLPGGRTNFKFLLTVAEGQQNFFTLCSSASRLSFERHLYFGGLAAMNLHPFWRRKLENWYSNAPSAVAATIEPHASSLVIPAAEAREEEEEVDWSSLPVLPLWKIMDMLDVFDNRRLGAVCRDWWSVSVRYPKKLYSVGDGEPWICHIRYGMESPTWEFISVSKKRRFEVTMPEFARSRAIFSNGGWILLQTSGFLGRGELGSWCLVNLFTKDKIKLPERGGNNAKCHGSFKLGGDGCPDRVYLIIPESPYQIRINTARPGDKDWASHNFTCPDRTLFRSELEHFVIEHTVYCQGLNPELKVFSLADNSVKALSPPPSLTGLIKEHAGELLHIEPAEVGGSSRGRRRRIKPIVVHKYHVASSSWEELKHNPVMGTSWYKSYGKGTLSAKGSSGTKSYQIGRKVKDSEPSHDMYVFVRDLQTGKRKTLDIPFPKHSYMFWVAIG